MLTKALQLKLYGAPSNIVIICNSNNEVTKAIICKSNNEVTNWHYQYVTVPTNACFNLKNLPLVL